MIEKETPYGSDSIVGLILSASDNERRRCLETKAALEASNRLVVKLGKLSMEAEERAQLAQKGKEELEEKSLEDPMTGCFNGNYFIKFAEERFDPNRHNGSLALVYLDINNLKQTNDTFGHAAGDAVIKTTADLLKSEGRKSENTVIHLHGDEFVIICDRCIMSDDGTEESEREIGVDFETALEMMMQRLLSKTEDIDPPIRFSYGIAVYDEELDENPPEELAPSVEVLNLGDTSKLFHTLSRADTKMYAQKHETPIVTTE